MTDEQKAAFIMGQVASAMAEIAGMQAENQERKMRGESPRYREWNFTEIEKKYLISHNAVLSLFHEN